MTEGISFGNLAAGGAIGGMFLGIVTACWTKIKAVAWRLASLLIMRVETPDHCLASIICSYLIQRRKRSAFYDRQYSQFHEHIRNGQFGVIPFEYLTHRTMVFWHGWFPLLYSFSAQKGSSSGEPGTNSYSLLCLRGTIDIEAIIADACKQRNDSRAENTSRRFFIRHVPEPKREEKGEKQLAPSAAGYSCDVWYREAYNRIVGYTPDDLGPFHAGPEKAMSYLIFPDHINKLVEELRCWRKSRDWYNARGIPWKRGWLMYGPPGSGKTALARAFAEDEDLPLFVFSLGELNNSDFMISWNELRTHIPCIALFEDFDNVFHGRKNVSKSSFAMFDMYDEYQSRRKRKKSSSEPQGSSSSSDEEHQPGRGGGGGDGSYSVTFDCLLNCLDGAQKAEGIFSIFTTNDLSKLDAALGQPRQLPGGQVEFISTRPGRIDKAIELGFMQRPEKLIMAERILGEFPEVHEDLIKWLDKHSGLEETPAQFQERCAQIALREFWRRQLETLKLEIVSDDEKLEEAA